MIPCNVLMVLFVFCICFPTLNWFLFFFLLSIGIFSFFNKAWFYALFIPIKFNKIAPSFIYPLMVIQLIGVYKPLQRELIINVIVITKLILIPYFFKLQEHVIK